jgi:hypothetical protein
VRDVRNASVGLAGHRRTELRTGRSKSNEGMAHVARGGRTEVQLGAEASYCDLGIRHALPIQRSTSGGVFASATKPHQH